MKSLSKNIFFSVVVIVLFFIALELACRIWVSFRRQDPMYLFYGRHFFELRVKNVFNKFYDLIHREENSKTREDSKVIWTFGGSTTACTYLKKKDSWPSRLEHHLNVTVINKGADGGTCDYIFHNFKNSLLGNEKRPDLVILYTGINDAVHIWHYEKKQQEKIPLQDIINCRLMDTSLFYATVKHKILQIVKKDKFVYNENWRLDNAVSPSLPTFSHFERDLNSIIDINEECGSELIISVVPLDYAYLKRYPRINDLFQEIIIAMENIAKRRNIRFLNTHMEIFKKYPNLLNCYSDGVHVNEEGNDLVAQFFADYLHRASLAPQ